VSRPKARQCKLQHVAAPRLRGIIASKKQFRKIVEDHLKWFFDQLDTNGQLRLCEDQFVGYVTVKNGKVVSGPATVEKPRPDSKKKLVDFAYRTPLTEWKRDAATSLPGVNPQIIIQTLESPHKEEYLPPGEPPRPAAGHARGETGWGLSKLYARAYPMHTHKLDDGKYALVLVNAIQYQCSLGVDTKVHRTKVFKDCWKKFGRALYVHRMKDIYEDGDTTINSCTSDEGLRDLVQEALEEALPDDATILKLNHPCTWQGIADMRDKGRSRKFEWVKKKKASA
jgi:hypothetical protein